MSDADDAYAAAERRIEEARAAGADHLDLAFDDCAALTRLPDSLATLDTLKTLVLGNPRAHVAVTDLSMLRRLPALTSLSLNRMQVSDLAPLAGITGLTRLDLDNTQVSDLAPLAGITGLTRLDLDNTQVSDLAPLAGITGLTTLYLNYTQVSDLAPLAGITGLTALSFDNTQVSDLAPLAQTLGLTTLVLGNTQVSDLAPLAGLTGLTTLLLNSTQVSDLAPLAGIAGLTALYLADTQVSDLAPLAGLTGLTELYLNDTQVSDLRPIRGLRKLAEEPGPFGLTFKGCAATRLDPRLAEIAEIENRKERAATLFDYLKDWVPPGDAERADPAPDAEQDKTPPDLPSKSPAPLETEIRGGRLRRAQPARPNAKGDPADRRAQQGWEELRKYRDGFGASFNVGNYAPLPAILTAFDRAFGESYAAMRQIGVGIQGERISALAEDKEFLETLPVGAATEMKGLAAAVATFVNRFPDWVAYQEDAEANEAGADSVVHAQGDLSGLGADLAEENRVDPEVAAEFESEVQATIEDPSSDDAAKGVLASARDVTRTLSEAALTEVRQGTAVKRFTAGARKTGITEFPKIVYYAGPGFAADMLGRMNPRLRRLARRFPKRFGWVNRVLNYLGYEDIPDE